MILQKCNENEKETLGENYQLFLGPFIMDNFWQNCVSNFDDVLFSFYAKESFQF